ncbi:MAG: hypothetical protein CBC25_00500 [Pelagibacteraceae bacterium TMED65]|jgi:hypothetical protein|nr:MAG: hypothetical protein CBC25_00500 [Pelagibacteraceae bacterium TMED65]|tara:strand:+ start:5104 stop:5388 length:285 start_codon:yes stop_codon:yes gene_type:complete
MEKKIELPDFFRDKLKIMSIQADKSNNTISLIVETLHKLSPSERGTLLLDLEDQLFKVNDKIRVWHVPIGDKNSLRNLRGISVNSTLSTTGEKK